MQSHPDQEDQIEQGGSGRRGLIVAGAIVGIVLLVVLLHLVGVVGG